MRELRLRVQTLSLNHHIEFSVYVFALCLIVDLPLSFVGLLLFHESPSFLSLTLHLLNVVEK